jgi:hypothetical protein
MTDPTSQLLYRLKILPTQLARARERYRQLLTEATSYRMHDLLAEEEQAMALPLVPAPPLGRDGAASVAPARGVHGGEA